MKTIAELLAFLQKGKNTAQDPRYHPEGSVYTHSLMVFWEAFYITSDIDIVTAALFHDIGKVGRDYNTEHKHARESTRIVTGILNEKQTWLISQHMRIGDYMRGSMKNELKRLELELHPWFEDLKVLYQCDRAARTLAGAAKIPHIEVILKDWFARTFEQVSK